eukprot:6908061-Prymnesium_polylepis.3
MLCTAHAPASAWLPTYCPPAQRCGGSTRSRSALSSKMRRRASSWGPPTRRRAARTSRRRRARGEADGRRAAEIVGAIGAVRAAQECCAGRAVRPMRSELLEPKELAAAWRMRGLAALVGGDCSPVCLSVWRGGRAVGRNATVRASLNESQNVSGKETLGTRNRHKFTWRARRRPCAAPRAHSRQTRDGLAARAAPRSRRQRQRVCLSWLEARDRSAARRRDRCRGLTGRQISDRLPRDGCSETVVHDSD